MAPAIPRFPLLLSNTIAPTDPAPWIVRDNGLEIRPDIYRTLKSCGYSSTEQFVGALIGAPEAFAPLIGCTAERLAELLVELKAQLRGRIANDLLDPAPAAPRTFPLGAILPDEQPKK